MNGLGAGSARDIENPLLVQVALSRGPEADGTPRPGRGVQDPGLSEWIATDATSSSRSAANADGDRSLALRQVPVFLALIPAYFSILGSADP
jgi:hypothetical protein